MAALQSFPTPSRDIAFSNVHVRRIPATDASFAADAAPARLALHAAGPSLQALLAPLNPLIGEAPSWCFAFPSHWCSSWCCWLASRPARSIPSSSRYSPMSSAVSVGSIFWSCSWR
ncbi:hypothetical protein G6F57_013032 [Rhizopus arrhizus]|nr:hypothetical protein G6F57_013032 [Rhizopus arrhizus]